MHNVTKYTPISVMVYSGAYTIISVAFMGETVLYYDVNDIPDYIQKYMDMAHKVTVDNTITIYANNIGM